MTSDNNLLIGLKRTDIGTKLMVFGIPIFLMLGVEFMCLTMQMGKPFCLQCFESGMLHPRFIIAFVVGYIFIVGILIAIISEDLRSLTKC